MAALAALALLIGGAILTMQDKKADTSNVERIIGYSALYGEESIGTAFDAVEQKFSEGFAGCTLLELRYDANVENKYADENDNNNNFYYGETNYFTEITQDDLLEEYNVQINPMIIGEIYILGIGVVFISILIPSFMIMRFNPKKILMNQN